MSKSQKGSKAQESKSEEQSDQAQQAQSEQKSSKSEEQSQAKSSDAIGERVARLEGKMDKEKSQEELYHERKAKYEAGVKAKREKEAKKAAALQAIDEE